MALSLATLDRVSPIASRVAAYVSCASVAGSTLWGVWTRSSAYLGLFEDDFYYYVVVANNLARLGKLTFDGVTLTNGFHPLWFGALYLVRVVTGGVGTPFFAVVAILLFAAMLATYEALRVFAQALGARPSVAAPIAALQGIAVNQIIASGLEVAVAIPLFAWMLALVARGGALTLRRAAWFGLLASFTVLARIDLACAVLLVVIGWLVAERPPWRTALGLLGAFSAGGAALVVYFAANWALFGALLPMSARAKQMRTGIAPNPHFVHSLLFDTVYGNRAVPALILGVLLLVWPKRWRSMSRSARLAAGVAFAFPVVFYASQLLLTNWALFAWYAYPLATAVVAAAVLVWDCCVELVPQRAGLGAAAIALGLCLTSVLARGARYFIAQGPRWSVEDNTLTAMGFELTERLRGFEGRFGMGDKAAGVAFILGRPIVQLEGLVADEAMLDHVRREESLDRFIAEYGIDYLIVSLGNTRLERRNGCYVVTHPNIDQSGPASYKSRTLICAEPIIHFETPHGRHRWSRWRGLETYVFDLRGERRKTLGAVH
jgi:hypothetical protein